VSEDREKSLAMAKRSVVQGYAARLPMMMVRNVVEAFGEKGWEVLEKAAREFAAYRAPLMKVVVEDPENARSLGSIFDFEDALSGVKGEWVETGAKEALKIERKCVASEVFKEYPDYCGRFLSKIAEETVRLMNPKAEVTPFHQAKCMVYGNTDVCEVRVKIKD